MQVNDFDYELPVHLIAEEPLATRSDSRLMVVDPLARTVDHAQFADIGSFLRSGDVMVFNNSRVLPARLVGTKEDTGARIELLLVRRTATLEWTVLAKPGKRLRAGSTIVFAGGGRARVLTRLDDGLWGVAFCLPAADESMEQFLDHAGTAPLPPYIHKPLADRERYQTVYAEPAGSVAAPTAGLHFTPQLLERIRSLGVETHFLTLHVGIGTFRPVKVAQVEDHHMHSEWYHIPATTAAAVNRARREARRVIAVGTTSLRSLESAAGTGEVLAGEAETDIFLYPGSSLRAVDALLTNFHLPKSTLLMLVAVFLGLDFTRTVYEMAVAQQYRFFSFGDAMLIERGVFAADKPASV